MNDVAFEVIYGIFLILLNIYHSYLIPHLTDLSASNDVSMIVQGYIDEENSKIPQSWIPSLICLKLINFSYNAIYMTYIPLMQPREFQSNSNLTRCADSIFFISLLL